MNRFLRAWAVSKNYFGYAGAYTAIVNFLLILATAKQAYGIPVSAFVLLPIGFFLFLLLGAADYYFIAAAQQEHNNKVNNMKVQLDRIEALVRSRL